MTVWETSLQYSPFMNVCVMSMLQLRGEVLNRVLSIPCIHPLPSSHAGALLLREKLPVMVVLTVWRPYLRPSNTVLHQLGNAQVPHLQALFTILKQSIVCVGGGGEPDLRG